MPDIDIRVKGLYRSIADDGNTVEFTDEFGNWEFTIVFFWNIDVLFVNTPNSFSIKRYSIAETEDDNSELSRDFPNLELGITIEYARRTHREFMRNY